MTGNAIDAAVRDGQRDRHGPATPPRPPRTGWAGVRPVAAQLDGLIGQRQVTRRPSRTVRDLFGTVATLTSGRRRLVSHWAPAARHAAKVDG